MLVPGARRTAVWFDAAGFDGTAVDEVRWAGWFIPTPAGIFFELAPGEVTAVLGPDPADTAAVLDLLLGFRRPAIGAVRLFGRLPSEAVHEGLVGAMIRRGGLMPDVTVAEVIEVVREVVPHPLPFGVITARADIDDLLTRRTESLSDGERLRVRFAVAIAGDPALLVLEAPAEGIDAATRARFRELVHEQARAGRTVLLATNEVADVDGVAGRFLVVHQHGLVGDVTAADLTAASTARGLSFHAPAAELELVCRLPGVRRAKLTDDVFHLHSTDPAATLTALRAAGITPNRLELGDRGVSAGYLDLVEAVTASMDVREDTPR